MGMLDDAIREHLELKRRHGAAEEEVAHLEAEVLAPRAEPTPSEPAEPAPEPAEPVADDAIAPAGPELEEAVEDAPAVHQVVPSFTDEEPWLDDADEAPHGETSEFTAGELADATGEAPTEYVEPDEDPGEDVLEETPDFLQETPEHDRLWFEQKPPRDFDFDK